MQDLFVGIALVFVIEGLLWAVWPQAALRLLALASEMPGNSLRAAGLFAMALGVVILWLVRG